MKLTAVIQLWALFILTKQGISDDELDGSGELDDDSEAGSAEPFSELNNTVVQTTIVPNVSPIMPVLPGVFPQLVPTPPSQHLGADSGDLPGSTQPLHDDGRKAAGKNGTVWRAPPHEKCACELSLSEKAFPHDKLQTLEGNAANCNSQITPQKTLEMESLLLGLERRVDQLKKDASILEKENDGELYGVLSLHIIENEMVEINQLMEKLNSTTLGHQLLTTDIFHQLDDLKVEMLELEKFDTMQVVKGRLANRHLKAALATCKNEINTTAAPTQPPYGSCQHGPLRNVTGPRVYTAGEYPGSHSYGAWGRDPKPEAGKESWYWLVMMTSSNRYGHYVRLYSGLSALIIGVSTPGNVQIHASNPTTNTIQGPNNVLYGGALYYNCYNQDDVCRFNLTSKTITTLELPKGTRYNSKGNFCHLDECYPFTDIDLATDESGVWVIYTTTQDFGNLVLSKVEEGAPPTLGQTWHTSVYKQSVSNTFMACGVLYATRYVNKTVEEIFYSFDTTTEKENFKVGIFIKKMSSNIQALNYSPVDQMLHAYCDSNMVSYKVLFG